MPFDNERASGDALIWLQNSPAIRQFAGRVREKDTSTQRSTVLTPAHIARSGWSPRRVIAVDGSSVTHRVRNGFPGAEATLTLISVVRIDLSKLAALRPEEIPRPRTFHEMESAHTVEAVLPGANVVRKESAEDTPLRFFRSQLNDTLREGVIAADHETLLETLNALVGDRIASIRCPIEDCAQTISIAPETQCCVCGAEKVYATDALRLAERFTDRGSNGEVHGEARHLIEVLVLINILRYFATPERAHYLAECVFVLDGPLAMFGHIAWLTEPLRRELQRLNEVVTHYTAKSLLLIGIEKTGQFVDHFNQLDWSDDFGMRGRFPISATFIPGYYYINENVVLRPVNAKPHGKDTYFGRKVFYKNRSGQHAVFTYAMTNPALEEFDQTEPTYFPRLGDALDVLDHLATYMYEDGFMPLVRAHAHAAIPLQRGADILESLFSD